MASEERSLSQVIDASRHRNEMALMNDFRDDAFQPTDEAEAIGYNRAPNIRLIPTWKVMPLSPRATEDSRFW